MRFKRERKFSAQSINMTSLVDVMLVLVLFFMLTTKFITYKAIELELGGVQEEEESTGNTQAATSPLMQQKEILIKVLPNRQLSINGMDIPVNEVKSYIKPRLLRNPEQKIVIETTKHILVQDIISAIDQVRLAGGKNFAITRGEG